QPRVALWNLSCFVQAVLPLLGQTSASAIEFGQQALERYPACYDAAWLRRMRAKLGLRTERDGDKELVDGLLRVMARQQADYSRVFRALGHVAADPRETAAPFVEEFADRAAAGDWLDHWRSRRDSEQGQG